MVSKECEFNQSETACGFCAGIAWCFPCLPATARDGELIRMQHSCHHVDIIRHPNSSYVTTKLYGTSKCVCNNYTIFSERTIFTFPTVDIYVGLAATKPWWFKMAAQFNSLFFVFNISFLPKYLVKYYDYIVKWCSGIQCNWCVSMDIA